MASRILPAILLLTLPYTNAITCPTKAESCSPSANTTTVNSCCVNKPGGQFLQTQFWDTNPVTGPNNSWTIHGLWPDNCDGTYDEDCDSSRAYADLADLLSEELVDYMRDYWQSDSGSPESFWAHEWATHGTCVSTLEPGCYENYTRGLEAREYFQTVVDLFKSLDTYAALSKMGITPSSEETYTAQQIRDALVEVTGKDAVVSCRGDGELYQVYYGFFVNGPLRNGDFVASTIVGKESDCPGSGIRYLPKGTAPTATTTTKVATTATETGTTPATSTATGTFSGKGYVNAYYKKSENGCLIAAGTWYTAGTCATYTATASESGFILASSNGNCGIVSDAFTCASGVTATVFTVVAGELAYDGVSTFYVSAVPTGSTQATVYTTEKTYSVTFEWQAI